MHSTTYRTIRFLARLLFLTICLIPLFVLPAYAHTNHHDPDPAFRRWEYRQATHFIAHPHLLHCTSRRIDAGTPCVRGDYRRAFRHLDWTGRLSYSERTEFCVELQNSRPVHPYMRSFIEFDHSDIPPGGIIKVCQDSSYRYHDGTPFRHMHHW